MKICIWGTVSNKKLALVWIKSGCKLKNEIFKLVHKTGHFLQKASRFVNTLWKGTLSIYVEFFNCYDKKIHI